MLAQMDLLQEASNLSQFRENFKSEAYIDFPKPIPGFISKHALVEVVRYQNKIFSLFFIKIVESFEKCAIILIRN